MNRADYTASSEEMIKHLIEVSRNQSEKVKIIAKELKEKVLNKQDITADWYNLKNQQRLQNMYIKELLKISDKCF